jgi:SnoaL-like domain
MELQPALTADEIIRLRRLLDVEEIRRVRLLYSHLLDAGETNALAQVFAEDAVCHFGPYGTWEGRETIHAGYLKSYETDVKMPFGTLHNTVDHRVELTSETTAVGRCYLNDVITHEGAVTPRPQGWMPIVWFAVYDDEYRKDDDGKWRISRMELHDASRRPLPMRRRSTRSNWHCSNALSVERWAALGLLGVSRIDRATASA